MRLFEFEKRKSNTEPNDVMQNIASIAQGASSDASYCYGQVAKAIANGTVDDTDLIVLLGSGNTSAHGIITDRQGNPKVDSMSSGFKGIEDGKYNYAKSEMPDKLFQYSPVLVTSVGKFKKKFMPV